MNKNKIWQKIKEDKTQIYGQSMLDVFLQITEELELDHYLELNDKQKKLITNPKMVFSIASQLNDQSKETSPELEKIISKDAESSYLYAMFIVNDNNIDWDKKRFELGEPAISESAQYSYLYAKDIIHGRWKPGELAISQSGYYSLQYAQYVVGRFELGEPAISKNANFSFYYAKDVIKKRFELGEPAILKDNSFRNLYKLFISRNLN